MIVIVFCVVAIALGFGAMILAVAGAGSSDVQPRDTLPLGYGGRAVIMMVLGLCLILSGLVCLPGGG